MLRSAADLIRNRRLRLAVQGGGYTYLVTDGEHVKIGMSMGNPRRRLSQLQTGSSRPLTVLAVLPGADREAELHRRFARLRVRGEWFRPGLDLLAFIREVTRGET